MIMYSMELDSVDPVFFARRAGFVHDAQIEPAKHRPGRTATAWTGLTSKIGQ